MVQDAVRLLDHLKIPRAHVVGYSLGAIITAKLLTTNADRFLSATLGAHAGYRNWRPEYDRSAQRTALELEGDVPFRSLAMAMTPSDEPKRSEDDIRSRSNALATANDLRALATYNRGGSRELNSTDDEVSAIKVPVLGVIGSLDNVRSMKQLQSILPSLKLVIIAGATHTGDRAAARQLEFVSAIREFIAAHHEPSQ
jgi:pimeloyl-ACP methyl ester carboxylesterase